MRHEMARAGIGHVRVNPRRARDFARAGGHLAKTDALDAAMLAPDGAGPEPGGRSAACPRA
ncbi:hypothetical protein [Paradevosia shaoguanensis]|uniref:Uncharacterized protein n=1 Tax=Paradevosia shaoguanensis TaxID=1335043 RepID=A0AA41QPL0_9HYPH|nr:hypothetical protein [Paradevosia shaoguanensis]MCF1743775.1 hypothetical protein [Paradevosia shaoguanensis]MCI0128258.1 hypothetical protein [Paradevosia shaoguanensis]